MEIIDISWPITQDMTGYKDKKNVRFKQLKTFDNDGVRESVILCGTHIGTHVDAPSHLLRDGKTIDQVSLSQLMGPCTVIDFTAIAEKIVPADLQKHDITKEQIVLFKTKNSLTSAVDDFDHQFVYLGASGAQYLAEKEVKAVGIDYLGIERDQEGHPSHGALMDKNIPIIEGLRLQQVEAGNYFFCCLPLLIMGLEAAPARAVLIRD